MRKMVILLVTLCIVLGFSSVSFAEVVRPISLVTLEKVLESAPVGRNFFEIIDEENTNQIVKAIAYKDNYTVVNKIANIIEVYKHSKTSKVNLPEVNKIIDYAKKMKKGEIKRVFIKEQYGGVCVKELKKVCKVLDVMNLKLIDDKSTEFYTQIIITK